MVQLLQGCMKELFSDLNVRNVIMAKMKEGKVFCEHFYHCDSPSLVITVNKFKSIIQLCCTLWLEVT